MNNNKVVKFEVAKALSQAGFHTKGFWIYNTKTESLTYTGADGFDEGEFNFLEDNYLDITTEDGLTQLGINKFRELSVVDTEREIYIMAPLVSDAIDYVAKLGVHVSLTSLATGWTWRVDTNNRTIHNSKTYESWYDAAHDALDKIIDLV